MDEMTRTRVEAALQVCLPDDWPNLLRERGKELSELRYVLDGEEVTFFQDELYFNPDELIAVNLAERAEDSETAQFFARWWETYVIIGTNGAGDYFCLRLDGTRGVWLIGSDCPHPPKQVWASLDEYIEERLEEYAEKCGEEE